MLVFNNQQRSGYEEIASYSPRYYRSIKEMDAVFRLAGWLIDLMARDMEDMVAFQFLKYMDDEALTRYEVFLGIIKDPNKTLDERKAYISALLIGSGNLSADKIKAIVRQFVDCECSVELSGAELCINMVFIDNPDRHMEDIRNFIRRKVPGHLFLLFFVVYRGEVQQTVHSQVPTVRFKTEFYPMFNLPELCLDGSWELDGSQSLDGYHGGDTIDLNPVSMAVQVPVCVDTAVDCQVGIRCGAEVAPDTGVAVRVSGEVGHEAGTETGIRMSLLAEHHISTEAVMHKENDLDDGWMLDGTRCLDGGDYPL